MKPKYAYYFGAGKAEGKSSQRNLLGGKGAGLAEMTRIGLPVPAGFTITVDACAYAIANKQRWPAGMQADYQTQRSTPIGRRHFFDPRARVCQFTRGFIQSVAIQDRGVAGNTQHAGFR